MCLAAASWGAALSSRVWLLHVCARSAERRLSSIGGESVECVSASERESWCRSRFSTSCRSPPHWKVFGEYEEKKCRVRQAAEAPEAQQNHRRHLREVRVRARTCADLQWPRRVGPYFKNNRPNHLSNDIGDPFILLLYTLTHSLHFLRT